MHVIHSAINVWTYFSPSIFVVQENRMFSTKLRSSMCSKESPIRWTRKEACSYLSIYQESRTVHIHYMKCDIAGLMSFLYFYLFNWTFRIATLYIFWPRFLHPQQWFLLERVMQLAFWLWCLETLVKEPSQSVVTWARYVKVGDIFELASLALYCVPLLNVILYDTLYLDICYSQRDLGPWISLRLENVIFLSALMWQAEGLIFRL